MPAQEFVFRNRSPIAPLKILAMDNCKKLGEMADRHVVEIRKENLLQYGDSDSSLAGRGYENSGYLMKASCPRFGSGEGKGVLNESVRGCDLFILTDVTNHSISFPLYGHDHFMSPDDHYQDLKRVVSAAMSSAYRVNVIMPFLYESRQHKRVNRESLDCAMALEELSDMGVSNIITFDAHDPRVQNAIPLHDFDNYSPVYHFMKALEKQYEGFPFNKDNLIIISPDEGAMHRAVYLANNLGVDMGMFYKRRDYSRVVNGRNPIVAHEYLGNDVEGKTVIVIDDIIASGESMVDTVRMLKERRARSIVICATFGLFTEGLGKFDAAYEKGYFDYLVTTNLNYRIPELLERSWYLEADMSKYIAYIIDTMNHNVAVSSVLTPTAKLQSLMERNGLR